MIVKLGPGEELNIEAVVFGRTEPVVLKLTSTDPSGAPKLVLDCAASPPNVVSADSLIWYRTKPE